MPRKLRYRLDLGGRTIAGPRDGWSVRSLSAEDVDRLAGLMLDAYVGTIDYDDETLEDAVEEVRQFFASGNAVPDRSFAVVEDGRIISAILVSLVDDEPFVSYVMTLPTHKERGLARLVTEIAMGQLAADGYVRATLYITEGNVASEALFRSLGAVLIEDD
ncbi:MAG TPA: GNAT family N-acetyltransferase [Acidimicrobiia bacterium]|nr:GNAT family N-acetyltransferase [Acidimicrobiia bacterium]